MSNYVSIKLNSILHSLSQMYEILIYCNYINYNFIKQDLLKLLF